MEIVGGWTKQPNLAKLARMSIDKQFRGDLVGSSQGEMVIPDSGTEEVAGLHGTLHVPGVRSQFI